MDSVPDFTECGCYKDWDNTDEERQKRIWQAVQRMLQVKRAQEGEDAYWDALADVNEDFLKRTGYYKDFDKNSLKEQEKINMDI